MWLTELIFPLQKIIRWQPVYKNSQEPWAILVISAIWGSSDPPMADDTISFAEWLGFKAQDSNELRRKQKNSLENPKSSMPIELQTPHSHISRESFTGFITGNPVPTSSSTRFGIHSPKSTKNPSPFRKLRQAFLEESLKLEAEEREARVRGIHQQSGCHQLEVQNSNPSIHQQSDCHQLEIQSSKPKILFNGRGDSLCGGRP